jgi:hypothetical protein
MPYKYNPFTKKLDNTSAVGPAGATGATGPAGPALTNAATIAVTTENTDTTCFPLFITADSAGDYDLKVDASLTYNSNTNALGCSLFAANTITANTAFVPDTNDGATLGTTALQFADLFLAEGGVINWDNGDATFTQAENVLTLSGAGLVVADAAGIELGIDAATNTAGVIKLWSAGANNYYTTFTAAEQSANATYILPTAMPGANSILQSSSTGTLSWVANTTFSIAAGSSSITTVGTVGTGSWHATEIAYDHGGTGLTAYPVKTIVLPAASAALGTTTPATRETRELTTNKQVLDVLKFAHTGVCIAWWVFQLPDSYNGGIINAKITYMNVATDGTNNFLFSLSAGCIADAETLDMALGAVQELETVVGDTAEDLKIGTWSTGITPSGTPAGGKLLVLKLQRDPTDTAHDTTSLDAYVLGLRLEYTVNSWSD